MAGRVQRRINDKFYFVLDEVGESSDCETELASDTNAVRADGLTRMVDVTSEIDSHAAKNNTKFEDLINRSPSLEENTLQLSSSSDKSLEKKEKCGSSRSLSSKYKHDEKNNLQREESCNIVDMEIDSDSECTEFEIKPLLRITFRDEIIEKRLKSSIFNLIFQKFENCTIITNSENNLELEVYDKNPKKLIQNDLLDFNLDTTPGDNHVDIPNYGKSHDLCLSGKSVELKKNNGKLHSSMTSCFNCLGNHNLRDCPEVKDFRTINKNRLKFQSQKNKSTKTSRYHLDEDQKFSHLMPGVISKKLRNALNLKRDQQPAFIYRMRQLGYPPAWLEEAKVSHSGVTMYDDTGIPVLEEDEEEGEIIPEGSKDKFDITKIIDFPGFNVPLPGNFKDESKYYQCPAYSQEQSKENLIKLLEPKTVQAYVKKSFSSQKLEAISSLENKKTTASPTIEEMEEKKRQLLMELNSEESCSNGKVVVEDSFACQMLISESHKSKQVGEVKNSEFGTPILKSVSPFYKLPSREKFSCNVSDVINFENLPNSTGKYETMREVISKIRTSTSKNQKE